MDPDSSSFSTTLSAIIVIICLFLLAFFIVPKMFAGVQPITGMEGGQEVKPIQFTSFPQNQYIENVQLETDSYFADIKIQVGSAEHIAELPTALIVYKSFGLSFTTEGKPLKSIKNVLITFGIPDDWMIRQGLDPDDIRMYSWDGDSWESATVAELAPEVLIKHFEAGGMKDGSFAIGGVLKK